jgi:hypothetical protein
MTPDRARIFAHQVREKLALPLYAVGHIEDVILKACAEQREMDAMICDTTAEFHGFYGTAAKDAAVKIRGQT